MKKVYGGKKGDAENVRRKEEFFLHQHFVKRERGGGGGGEIENIKKQKTKKQEGSIVPCQHPARITPA